MSFIAERILTVADVNLSLGGLLYATTGEVIGSTSLRVLYLGSFYSSGECNEERSGGTCSVVYLNVGLEGGKSYAIFHQTEHNFVLLCVESESVGGLSGRGFLTVAIALEHIVCGFCLLAFFVGYREGKFLSTVGLEDDGRWQRG